MKFINTLTNSLILVLAGLLLSHCSSTNSNLSNTTSMEGKTIMEVTTFNLKSGVDPSAFAERDMKVEEDFTSKQAGFIKRISGVNEKGEIVVTVFWKSTDDAAASMKKFMGDASVSDYANMIDGETMNMNRYVMDEAFKADDSKSVELMAFDLKEGTDAKSFGKLNK